MRAELVDVLACPEDRLPLRPHDSGLRCPGGHRYPIVRGIPVLLRTGVPQTLWVATASIQAASDAARHQRDDLFVETVGISAEERAGVLELASRNVGGVDPVVSFIVAGTSGNTYRHLIGHVVDYPIPALRLPAGRGDRLLDVGCNWGRWAIAAARKGYRVVGVDPSLGAVLAAARVADSLGVSADFVVGDARYLPFREGSFDVVFSYSVIQHFSRKDAQIAVGEMARVLRTGGYALVQMAHSIGVGTLYHQARARFREADKFGVRYWSIKGLRDLFRCVGSISFDIDCFFGIGLQPSDIAVMPAGIRAAIRVSEFLRGVGHYVKPLVYVADSLYVRARKDLR